MKKKKTKVETKIEKKKEQAFKKTNEAKTTSDKQNKKPAVSISQTTRRLLTDISSLGLVMNAVVTPLMENAKKSVDAFAVFVKKYPPVKSSGNQKQISIPVGKGEELNRLVRNMAVSMNSVPLSTRGLFLVLISKWDAFLGSMLRWLYEHEPEIINASGRPIPFSELHNIEDIRIVRERIIDEEISSVLRQSHIDHFEYLEKKTKLALRSDAELWSKFVEITQRRHLIAHTDGRVSQQYLQVCQTSGVDLKESEKLNNKIQISQTYFQESSDLLAELGVKLSQVLWRKLKPEEAGKADASLIDMTFDMIVAEQYRPAIAILSFALKPPMKFIEARSRLICIVNLSLAYKLAGDSDKSQKIVDVEDWSASSLDFQMAVAVLRDQFDVAAKLMKRMGKSGEVEKENYEMWPLFREFRKDSLFLKTYKEVFGTEIEIREVSADMTSLVTEIDKSINKADEKKKN
jgi:hypothetical protein